MNPKTELNFPQRDALRSSEAKAGFTLPLLFFPWR